LFVIAVLALRASLDRLLALKLAFFREVLAYLIGSLAATWFIQRVVAMA
jgi:hypothetical protein